MSNKPSRRWITSTSDEDVGSRALSRILNDMVVKDYRVRDRLENYLNLIPEVFDEGKVRMSSTGMCIANELEVHAWVPSKKNLKSTWRNRTEISQETFDRIPARVHTFLRSNDQGSILSSNTKPLHLKLNRVTGSMAETPTVTVYGTYLIDYASTKLTKVNGKDVLILEIHEYRPIRSALYLVIYLND